MCTGVNLKCTVIQVSLLLYYSQKYLRKKISPSSATFYLPQYGKGRCILYEIFNTGEKIHG